MQHIVFTKTESLRKLTLHNITSDIFLRHTMKIHVISEFVPATRKQFISARPGNGFKLLRTQISIQTLLEVQCHLV